MLVLSRRLGEEIVIADCIRVEVLSFTKGKVRLGISAPDHIRVDRREVHDRLEFQTGEWDEPVFVNGEE